jgi:predicted alpha/beta superfamily hydrolase
MKRFIFKALLIIQFTFFFCTNVAAQPAIPSVELGGTELHVFKTTSGQEYELYISLPRGYVQEGDVKYPVLYFTDAYHLFSLYYGVYKSLQFGEARPLILVGIDKPVSSTSEWAASRFLDLTPTKNTITEGRFSEAYGRDVLSGGADNFLKILQSEIIPWVEERFSVSGERGLAGYSLGGLFATHVLLTSPELFQQYLIGSPTLQWDDEIMFEREEAFNDNHPDISAHVYLSAGTEEEMNLAVMLKFSETLKSRSYESLILEHHIFENETHASVIPATISRGLVTLYGNP